MTQLLTPPNDGSRNTVIIFGRLYQSAPGVPIAVPNFDAPTLEANGWTVFIGAASPTTTSAYAAGAVSGVVTSPSGSPGGIGVRLFIDGAAHADRGERRRRKRKLVGADGKSRSGVAHIQRRNRREHRIVSGCSANRQRRHGFQQFSE